MKEDEIMESESSREESLSNSKGESSSDYSLERVTLKPLLPKEVSEDYLKMKMKSDKEQKEQREKERAERIQ
ncbi:hypothetical protein CR513_23993, partial [Mucuna pruriens]